MSKILITGGAGFIGSNIVLELVNRGEETRVLDNLVTGDKRNIEDVKNDIEFIEGDIRDLKTVRKAVEDIDYIIHAAALPSVSRSIKDPITTNDVNVSGTLNLLTVAKDADVKRFIFASSSSIYGDSPKLPKEEGMCPDPKSPYAISKLVGEQYCKIFCDIYNLETVSLRYFNVFGPRQNPTSEYAAVIPKFINLMLKGKRPTIYGDGNQSRDFTFVKNVVDATIRAIKVKNISGEVINVACGERITINDLTKRINEILGTSIRPVYADSRPGDVRHSLADISKAKRILGYKPAYFFEEGLKETIKWFQDERNNMYSGFRLCGITSRHRIC